MAAVALTVAPARAAQSQCNVDLVGRFCIWSGTDYRGSFGYFVFATDDCVKSSTGFRSGMNGLSGGVRVWSGTDCTGSSYIFPNNGTDIDKTGNIGFTARSVRRL